MLKVWGGYVLTQANYVNAFFSHDEYIDFFAMLDKNLGLFRVFWWVGFRLYGSTMLVLAIPEGPHAERFS